MNKLKIRQAKVTDKTVLLPQLMVFYEQHAVYDEGHVTDKTRREVEEIIVRDTRKKKYWVAEAEKQIVGFIKAEIMDTHPDTVLIDNLYIDPKYRRQGIGTQLIAFIEDLFNKKGATKSRLWVAKMNTEAENLYKKLGFEFKEDIWKQYIKKLS